MNNKRGIPVKNLKTYKKHLFITIFLFSVSLFFILSFIYRFRKSEKKVYAGNKRIEKISKKNRKIVEKRNSKILTFSENKNKKQKLNKVLENNYLSILDDDFFIKINDDIKIKMVLIPPSKLIKKYKKVIVPFHISKYEVTQKIWYKVMGYNPSIFIGENLPVNNITYEEVKDFIKKINKLSDKKLRLPRIDEWQFACRGGSRTIYYWGNFIDEKFGDYCWYSKNSSKKPHIGTQEVGKKIPNNWGLYDMNGNVSEFVETDYSINFKKGISTHKIKVCGGSWIDNPEECKSSSLKSIDERGKKSHIGFRLAF